MAPAQLQILIDLSQLGFTQVLANNGSVTNWSFPVQYNLGGGSQAAEIAQIQIDGNVTSLKSGLQTITDSGAIVSLYVELGPAGAVGINANPNNQTDCTYPFSSIFGGGSSQFLIACSSETTHWNLDVALTIVSDPDPEIPPTTANVNVIVNGFTYEPVFEGPSTNFTPSGTTLGFALSNVEGNGKIQLQYTLQPVTAAA